MIETERLVLRELTFSDAKDIYDVLTEEGVARWLGMKPVSSVEEAWDFLERFIDSIFVDMYGITEKGSDKVIGIVQIADRWYRRKSLGYCLAAKYRGKGYMTEMVRAVVQYLFEDTPWLNAILIEVFDGNEASERVARKCGFFFDGMKMDVLSPYGNVEDERHFSLTVGDYEWAKRKRA